MKSGSSSAVSSLSGAARAEAAAWVARLHSSSRTPALEAGLRKWLKSDPANVRAFEMATEAWEIGGSVRSGAMPRMADPFVEPRRAGGTRYLALAASVLIVAAGALLYTRQQVPSIVTAIGEQRSLTLADGTRVYLNTDTRLFVREGATDRRITLESGEALFDVAKDPHRPFVVIAGGKEVLALGTSFIVRHDSQRLSVMLVEGKVAVSSSADENSADPTVLAPGQRLTFADRAPPKMDAPSIEKVTAWRKGEVILDKTRLRDAVDEMNRYSAIRLVIDDAAADIPVSGIFRTGDSARFAQAVAETYHLTIDPQQNHIRISAPNH